MTQVLLSYLANTFALGRLLSNGARYLDGTLRLAGFFLPDADQRSKPFETTSAQVTFI